MSPTAPWLALHPLSKKPVCLGSVCSLHCPCATDAHKFLSEIDSRVFLGFLLKEEILDFTYGPFAPPGVITEP